MKKNNVFKFPITYTKKRKNINGPLLVECEISSRYIKFDSTSVNLQGGEFIHLDIFTNSDSSEGMRIDESKSKKLCELVITREDLMLALENIKPKETNEDE